MPYNYYANQYVPSGYNPYYQNYQRPVEPRTLLGKVVDNMEVVKAVDIPLDGSISYYPLADGTAILSKQLQQDGTSKIVVYRPEEQKQIKYVTENDLNNVKDEIKALKEQLEKRGDNHESV